MQGLPHVVVYIDDILVTESTEEEHLRTLEEVLDRLEKAGARLKREKCRFMLPMVEYLVETSTHSPEYYSAEGISRPPELLWEVCA